MAGGARTAAASSSRPRRPTTRHAPERSLPCRPPAGEPSLRVLLRSTRNDIQSNHSTGRRPRGLSRPHPALDREPAAAAGLPRPGAGAPADRAGLRRGRRRSSCCTRACSAAIPIAVRVADTTIALRRREAMAILVTASTVVNAAIELAPVVALVGNPNCGKTALFNALTGSRQKVANYPGVTVEKKVGRARRRRPAGRSQVVDLPGTYSLRARSPDEEITRDVVLGKPAERARARPDRLRRRRLQPAAGAAPRARAEARRPAGDAGAQHDGHRPQARHRDRHRAPVARARRAGGELGRGAPRRHRRAAGRHRPRVSPSSSAG